MKTHKIFILFLVLITSSCEFTKEIDYNTFYDGDRIIVHGFVSPQNGVHILMKKSVAPNYVLSDDKVQNAIVTLYEDDIAIKQLQKIDDYHYGTEIDFELNFGKAYSIKINAENFNEIFSNQQPLFAPVPIDSLKIIVEDHTFYKNLVICFKSSNQFEGGYYLKVYYYLDGVIDSSLIGSEIFNPYGLLENIVVGTNFAERQLFNKFDSIKVELYTLSPDLTTFLKSFQKYDASKEDPFFEQTYPVFSNIINGYGIFASYSISSKIISK
jgi:hypothetical protein